MTGRQNAQNYWNGLQQKGSQRLGFRKNGRQAIRQGLGLRDDRRLKRPKLLTWLAAEEISAVSIQRVVSRANGVWVFR